VYGENGNYYTYLTKEGISYRKGREAVNVSGTSFFKLANDSEGEYVISEPHIALYRAPLSVIKIMYILRDAKEEKNGYIFCQIPVTAVQDALANVPGCHSRAWICNRKGEIILEARQKIGGSHLESLTDMKGQPGETGEILPVRIGNETLYATSVALSHTPGWRLCIALDRNSFYGDFREQTVLFLFLLVLFFLFVVSGAFFFSKRQTAELTRMAQAMELYDPKVPSQLPSAACSFETALLKKNICRMDENIRTLLLRIEKEEREKREAEYRALQAQINPHFLYNTMDTIIWKAEAHGAYEVAEIALALADFFRHTLNHGESFATAEDELEQVYCYLFIQKFRYKDRLQFVIDMDPLIKDTKLPKLLIQPLVENALYHGIKPKGGGSICVSAFPLVKNDRGFICLRVEDDGVGMAPEKLQSVLRAEAEAGQGYGIFNVRERLRLIYRDKGELKMESEEGNGTCVEICIPLLGREEEVC